MAYASTVTVKQQRSGCFILTITETEAAAASEVEIDPDDPAGDSSQPAIPKTGRVLARTCSLTAGTGTTVDPVLGQITNPANSAWRMENNTAAVRTHEVNVTPIPYHLSGSFFHRSVVDAAADNSITTVYYIVAGW